MINGVTMKILADDYILRALQEDVTSEDVTTNAVMPMPKQGKAQLICKETGIIAGLSRRLAPVLHFLFPDIPKDHPANKYIATNMIANIFGLGWAATPAGLKAMEALAELEKERGKKAFSDGTVKKGERTASNEMCDFLIINISSLQIIPVNIIAYRSQYGSVNPAQIVGPALIATTCSTLTAIIFCKIRQNIYKI